VFDKQVLHALLTQAPAHTDFGKDILPPAASEHNVQAYLFQDYWEDIGTIEAFYQVLSLNELQTLKLSTKQLCDRTLKGPSRPGYRGTGTAVQIAPPASPSSGDGR
jgi:ADP-glucose pyrophosphorylase